MELLGSFSGNVCIGDVPITQKLDELHSNIFAAIGFYRDHMPPEAVKRFQELGDEVAELKRAMEVA